MARTPSSENATATARKGKQVSATIPAELYSVLDDHRWSARIDGMTQLTRVALEEYATNHGLVPADSPAADVPGE